MNPCQKQAMMLWAAKHAPELATPEQQEKWIESLRNLQQEDGGWVLAQLGDAQWQREDKKPHHQISDGYATALVVYVLRQAGVSREDPGIVRGVKWLKANQRESGRWFTHSPRRDGRHHPESECAQCVHSVNAWPPRPAFRRTPSGLAGES